MSDLSLSPKARELIDSARAAIKPAAADRARIDALLRARLGADALSPPARVFSGSMAVGTSLAVCVVVGIVAWAAWGISSPPTAAPAQQQPQHFEAQAPAQSAEPAAPAPEVSASAPPEVAPTHAPRAPTLARNQPGPSQLSQEISLLKRATRLLSQGDATKALKLLEEHRRRFPEGLLLEERRAARALALCALGRVDEGRAEQALLPTSSPGAARVQRACAESGR